MLNNMFFQDFGRKSLKSSVRLTKQDSDDGYFHFIVTHIALANAANRSYMIFSDLYRVGMKFEPNFYDV